MKRLIGILKKIFVLVLVLLIIVYGYTLLLTVKYPVYYNDHVLKYSSLYGVDPYLVISIINVESGFDKMAVSNKDAKGLMQIMPATGKWIADKVNKEDYYEDLLLDPEINIQFGTWYIDYLLSVFNHRHVALAAYNGGMGNVSKWLLDQRYSHDGESLYDIPFSETKKYVDKVNKNYDNYKLLYRDLQPIEKDIGILRTTYINFINLIKNYLSLN